ncbi:MAG: AMP-binding protein, partial [Pseudomonadota bacterium]
MKLTDYTTYADAQAHYRSAQLWDLFSGDREQLNLAYECIDRHAAEGDRVAVRIIRADGNDEILTFQQIASASSQFAHWLTEQGAQKGDRICIMLEPSL